MLKKYLAVVLCLFFSCISCTAEKAIIAKDRTEEAAPQTRIARYVRELSGEETEGRGVATRGEARAAFYLAKHLQQLGLRPAGNDGTFFQAFPIGGIVSLQAGQRATLRLDSGGDKAYSENVLGIIPGRSEEIIIISAHYDHLGKHSGTLYPGANDNGSGTALLMELASALSKTTPHYTTLVAFWGGEEAGLLGSSYFANNPADFDREVKCIINLDSLGNLKADKKLLVWKNYEDAFSKQYIDSLTKAGWEIKWEENPLHSSDHLPFAKHDVSGFTLLSPYWLENNHTPDDTAKTIDYKLLSDFADDLKELLI